jgi:hypothetical protein
MPVRDDRKRPVVSLETERPRRRIPKITDRVGSINVNTNRFRKLVLDIEKTASARIGIMANIPITTADTGNSKLFNTSDTMEPMKRKKTHVEIVNREKARQRLK